MSESGSPIFTCETKREDSTQRASEMLYKQELQETFGAFLTRRQWRLVVSALSEAEHEESEELAEELLFYVLPANLQSDPKG